MQQPDIKLWGPAAVIMFGYVAAAFWQNKRVDDLKTWLSAEFNHLNEKIDKLDTRVKALEDARNSGVVGVR
ncbi:MAG TPA: hypothetical protein VN633_19135 [Bryobacteraceae bacterium]|nr:hypothetical protein [Bryobacteraceae bacterium]